MKIDKVYIPREEIFYFSMLMEKILQLPKNTRKKHWTYYSMANLVRKLNNEFDELKTEVIIHEKLMYSSTFKTREANRERIKNEAIDMANFLMMIVDNINKEKL